MSSTYGIGSSNVGVTYQFIVIAVVACGLFAAGVMTVMYRRRRRQFLRELRDWDGDGHPGAVGYDWGLRPRDRHGHGGPGIGATRLVLNDRGMFVEVPAKKKRKLGPEPVLWDAEISPDTGEKVAEDDDSEYDAASASSAGKEKEKHVYDADIIDWKPTAVALPGAGTDTPSLQNPFAPALDLTVLLAMPDPSLVFDESRPDAYNPPPRPPRVNEYGEEEVDIPPLHLGVMELQVEGAWEDIEALRPPPPKAKEPRVEDRGRRSMRVRVDGFSRSLLRG